MSLPFNARRNRYEKETHALGGNPLNNAIMRTYVGQWVPPECKASHDATFEKECLARVAQTVSPLRAETTPSNCIAPLIPCRIKRFFPRAKVVMLLRHPVGRALSKYFGGTSNNSDYVKKYGKQYTLPWARAGAASGLKPADVTLRKLTQRARSEKARKFEAAVQAEL